jgi:hypothetical protein
MDGSRFDQLTQRLAAIQLSRKQALRGLVGGVTALTVGTAFTGEAEAGKKKKPICHCDREGTCTTERMKGKQRKAHLRNDQCDYLGECRSDIQGCAAAPRSANEDRQGTACSNNNPCGANSGLTCVAGICLPIDLGASCTNNGECTTGNCENGECALCPLVRVCGDGPTAQCCTVEATCHPVDNVCVL